MDRLQQVYLLGLLVGTLSKLGVNANEVVAPREGHENDPMIIKFSDPDTGTEFEVTISKIEISDSRS